MLTGVCRSQECPLLQAAVEPRPWPFGGCFCARSGCAIYLRIARSGRFKHSTFRLLRLETALRGGDPGPRAHEEGPASRALRLRRRALIGRSRDGLQGTSARTYAVRVRSHTARKTQNAERRIRSPRARSCTRPARPLPRRVPCGRVRRGS